MQKANTKTRNNKTKTETIAKQNITILSFFSKVNKKTIKKKKKNYSIKLCKNTTAYIK